MFLSSGDTFGSELCTILKIGGANGLGLSFNFFFFFIISVGFKRKPRTVVVWCECGLDLKYFRICGI